MKDQGSFSGENGYAHDVVTHIVHVNCQVDSSILISFFCLKIVSCYQNSWRKKFEQCRYDLYIEITKSRKYRSKAWSFYKHRSFFRFDLHIVQNIAASGVGAPHEVGAPYGKFWIRHWLELMELSIPSWSSTTRNTESNIEQLVKCGQFHDSRTPCCAWDKINDWVLLSKHFHIFTLTDIPLWVFKSWTFWLIRFIQNYKTFHNIAQVTLILLLPSASLLVCPASVVAAVVVPLICLFFVDTSPANTNLAIRNNHQISVRTTKWSSGNVSLNLRFGRFGVEHYVKVNHLDVDNLSKRKI